MLKTYQIYIIKGKKRIPLAKNIDPKKISLKQAKEYLKNHGINTKAKIFKNCEHKIPVEGSSLGLAFLKENLL